MARVKDVSKYLLNLSKPKTEESITNLKLQKLLYYAQGFYLAFYDTRLFNDEIEAWAHGPVVPSIYHDYKDNKYNEITKKYNPVEINLSNQEKELIEEVWDIFKAYDGKELEKLTHSEDPWKDTRGTLPEYAYSDEKIAPELIKTYFKQKYVN